jgi:hypothetical protein
VLSFFDFEFITKNFLFLKTTTGRGIFDIFCSFMFLVSASVDDASIMGYVMMGVLMVCGIFFIVFGALGKNPAGEDFKQSDVQASAAKTTLL